MTEASKSSLSVSEAYGICRFCPARFVADLKYVCNPTALSREQGKNPPQNCPRSIKSAEGSTPSAELLLRKKLGK